MKDSGAQVTSFVLNHMKVRDMRATEDLRKGDRVHVKGREITGVIVKFDADGRLAWLDLGHYAGWWHVKDLERIKNGHAGEYFQGSFLSTKNIKIKSGIDIDIAQPMDPLMDLCERMDAWIKM